MNKIIFLFIFSLAFYCRAQSLNEIIESYNNSIDPNGKLDSIAEIQFDITHKAFNLENGLFLDETLTNTYSIYGDNYSINWKDGIKRDMNIFTISEWQRENIIKNHFNLLIREDDEVFELIESNDSIYIVKMFSDDREVYHEIDRLTYNLKKRITRSKGKEMTLAFSEYKIIEGVNTPTVMKFYSELGNAEITNSNYRFTKISKEKD
ncbi:hypothetical protein QWY31_12210 [Cytophagales bacterium LB-30]|uniref:Outer membrane lipoprotein carrier protein LolA n=1 Tax=Shiella aurantiaca TaxID=3058365 RepID=A0ABT8F7Q7_9BACT|nr:hypothetical protein [Shiella aurantiaca]MDN4166269.1 hypothetical protein [Shiella aurantiaca]